MNYKIRIPRVPTVSPTVLALFALGLSSLSLQAAENQRPNVILVLTDDQGYGDFSVHGNPVLQTPVLDKLHDRSIRFTDFHVAPMCTPTRAQLLTGRDAVDNGATAVCMGRSMPREDLPMMADIFKASGYRTAHFGKWHLGDSYPYRPQDRGFEESVTFGAFGIGSIADWYGNTYWSANFRHSGAMQRSEGYCTDVWFDMALDYLEDWKEGSDPFFLYLPTNCPHDPHLCDDRYSDPYLAKGIDPVVAKFFGQIANIDENMGRLLDRLDQSGLADNTLLIYMSDNGTAKGHSVFNAGMRGSKKDPYDGGHRVPLFIRWPSGNLGAPRDIETLTQCQDILPTLIDWCKLQIPKEADFDGSSLAPLLSEDPDALNDRMLVVEYDNPYRPGDNKAVMWKKWRLVKGRELYDISVDPGQATDVAGKHPEVVRHMQSYYQQWKQEAMQGYNQKRLIHLGSEAQNPLMLYSSDWQGDYADNINNLVAGDRIGSWDVSVEQPGMYEFTLSRWHPASGLALTESIKDARGRGRGAIPVKQARLKIGAFDQTVSTTADQTDVKFRVELPKGNHKVETWLMDADGQPLCSAYYTQAEHVHRVADTD
ncbi:Arylsulfatase [Novipirellula aureliae]|uniref:Arylsulfatase n=1 Tax=Novipirellula aureliae TaxID=2527966 RepID=A0A5C6E779_9BACT|nr:arylsulfatase [Novipirellula aureliae]TWU43521.1 Arylsulfatase [Novipirellula aureliae]